MILLQDQYLDVVCSIRQLGLVKKELEGALGILRRADDVGAGDGGRIDSVIALKERGAHETIRTGHVHSTACTEVYRKRLHLLLYQLKLTVTENCCIFLLYQQKLTENCCIFCCISRSLQKTVASFVVSAEAYRKLLHLLLYHQKLTENSCIFFCISRSLQLQKTVAFFVVSTEAYRKLLHLLLY